MTTTVEPIRILEIAEKELSIYESLLKINGFTSDIRVDHPTKINEDGRETVYMYFTDTIKVTDSVYEFINGNHIYSPQNESVEDSKVILNKISSNNIKKELLILLGLEANWINAYKIYEILNKHHMKDKDIRKIAELRYFTYSANSPNAIGVNQARHAVQSQQNPKEITNLKLAYSSLVALALQFIKSDA